MLIDLIAGARPNYVKVAPLIRALEEAAADGAPLRYRLIETGQHNDPRLTRQIAEELGMPQPHINLQAVGNTPAAQMGAIMERYEALLQKQVPDVTLVVGDVTSTLACALTAKKAGVLLAHVEAGLRSGDRAMPEEINRLATDAISDLFFTTTVAAGENLQKEGVPSDRIFFVGNVMIDSLLQHQETDRPSPITERHALRPKEYWVLTLHRPSNVDDASRLNDLISGILEGTAEPPVIFPVHPRTKNVLESLSGFPPQLLLEEPIGYLDFIHLVGRAKGVITDSGGISEETTVLGVPCITLRTTTERPETCSIGTNRLVGNNIGDLQKAILEIKKGLWPKGTIPDLWDGHTAERVITVLQQFVSAKQRS